MPIQCLCAHMYICILMSVCIHLLMYVCMYVCVFVIFYVNSYVCVPLYYDVCTVDKWRVVLKGETPDYINASSINVSLSTDTLITKYFIFSLTDRAISAIEPLSSPWDPCHPQSGISGRWFMTI